MLQYPSKECKSIFQSFSITRESFLQVLATVRANQRVTSDTPKATYDTLEKYGTDLVEKAKQ